MAIDCSPSDPVIEVYIVYYPNGVWQPAWQPPVVANNGTYNLSSVTKEQSGTYTCVGQTQDFILTESVNLTVLSGTNELTFSIVHCLRYCCWLCRQRLCRQTV